MVIALLILIYVVSSICMWWWMKLALSKGGAWEVLTPDMDCIFLTFFPFVNTYVCIILYLCKPPIKLKKRDFSKFFNVKK